MSKEKWLLAAKKYDEKRRAEKGEVQPDVLPELSPEMTKRIELVAVIEKALEDFERSDEFSAAYELLRASKMHVVIAVENQSDGKRLVYYLSEHGFMEAGEQTGARLIHRDERAGNKPQTKRASKRMIANLIVRQSDGSITADHVLNRLRRGLNAIANDIDR